jgi:hypothetical protein
MESFLLDIETTKRVTMVSYTISTKQAKRLAECHRTKKQKLTN